MIEVLVAVGIVTILAAMLFPALRQARENSHRTLCMNNLRQIGHALSLYAQDFDGYLPFEQRYDSLMWGHNRALGLGRLFACGYLIDGRVFYCPSQTALTYDDDLSGWENFGQPEQRCSSSYKTRNTSEWVSHPVGDQPSNFVRIDQYPTKAALVSDFNLPDLLQSHRMQGINVCYRDGRVAWIPGRWDHNTAIIPEWEFWAEMDKH